MKKYFRIYQTLLSLNFSSMVAYRGNFVGNAISSVAWGVFSVITILLLTSKVSSLVGWKREELVLLTAVYSVILGVVHTISTPNFSRYAQKIHWGQLDFILLKPLDSQFLMGFTIVNYAALVRLLFGIILVGYLVYIYHMPVSLAQIALFLVAAMGGYLLLYSLWSLIVTVTIWFSRLYNIDELLFDITGTGRYPKEMIEEIRNFLVILLLPITYVITTPTKILLNRAVIDDYVLLYSVAIVLFLAQRKFWKFALRYYTSASS